MTVKGGPGGGGGITFVFGSRQRGVGAQGVERASERIHLIHQAQGEGSAVLEDDALAYFCVVSQLVR